MSSGFCLAAQKAGGLSSSVHCCLTLSWACQEHMALPVELRGEGCSGQWRGAVREGGRQGFNGTRGRGTWRDRECEGRWETDRRARTGWEEEEDRD